MSYRESFDNRFSEPPPCRGCQCTVCVEAWEVWMEDRRHDDRLALLDAELRQAKPATQSEWAAFFDAEFPRHKTEPEPEEGITPYLSTDPDWRDYIALRKAEQPESFDG